MAEARWSPHVRGVKSGGSGTRASAGRRVRGPRQADEGGCGFACVIAPFAAFGQRRRDRLRSLVEQGRPQRITLTLLRDIPREALEMPAAERQNRGIGKGPACVLTSDEVPVALVAVTKATGLRGALPPVSPGS